MNIRNGESMNTKIVSQTINAFSFKAFVNANTFTTGDTTYGSSKVDFTKCQVKAMLRRGGADYVLFQDNLKILGLASNLNTRGQLAFYADHDHLIKLGNGKSLVSFMLHLGGPIKISGDDYIYLEVSNNDGLFDASYITTSYLEVKPVKCIGYETFIPQIRSQSIQEGTTSNIYPIGDNVIRCAFLNFDKTDSLTPVIASVGISSDRLNDTFTYADLMLNKEVSYAKTPVNLSTDAATINEYDQSFMLADFHQTFNQLSLSISFDGSQVASSKNYIVHWYYQTSTEIIRKAENLAAKHKNSAINAIPASTSPGK